MKWRWSILFESNFGDVGAVVYTGVFFTYLKQIYRLLFCMSVQIHKLTQHAWIDELVSMKREVYPAVCE